MSKQLVVRLCVAAIALTTLVPKSNAAVLYSQTFAFDTGTHAATLAAYPEFTFSGGGSLSVVGGVLNLLNGGNFTVPVSTYSPLYTGPIKIEADVTFAGDTSAGCCNVGVLLGSNRFIFHPGYGPGAFRIDNSAPPVGNQTMNYTPANNTLQHMVIESNGLGNFDISIYSPSTPNIVYQYLGYSAPGIVGQPLGFTAQGSALAYLDNLLITAPDPVPEPSTLALLGLGSIGLAIRARRRRAA